MVIMGDPRNTLPFSPLFLSRVRPACSTACAAGLLGRWGHAPGASCLGLRRGARSRLARAVFATACATGRAGPWSRRLASLFCFALRPAPALVRLHGAASHEQGAIALPLRTECGAPRPWVRPNAHPLTPAPSRPALVPARIVPAYYLQVSAVCTSAIQEPALHECKGRWPGLCDRASQGVGCRRLWLKPEAACRPRPADAAENGLRIPLPRPGAPKRTYASSCNGGAAAARAARARALDTSRRHAAALKSRGT